MNFTIRERRGAIAFIIVIMSLTILVSNDVLYTKKQPWYAVKDTVQVNAWLQSIMASQVLKPHKFDPNNTTVEELTSMGVSKAMAVSWIKYTDAGGFFNQPADLLRLHGMSDSIFSALKPFIHIQNRKQTYTRTNKYQKYTKQETEIKPFNPVNDSEQQLVKAGIPAHVASTIVKYRRAGGVFRQKTDLLNIYVIDSALYKRMEPHIQISDSTSISLITVDSVELNSVSFEELIKLKLSHKFIGGVLKYRDLLGGYYFVDQLEEVYGAQPHEVEKLAKACWIDSLQMHKMSINHLDQSQMCKHPYFRCEKVSKIIKYRNFAGRIENFREFKSLDLYSKSELEKLKPYLQFE